MTPLVTAWRDLRTLERGETLDDAGLERFVLWLRVQPGLDAPVDAAPGMYLLDLYRDTYIQFLHILTDGRQEQIQREAMAPMIRSMDRVRRSWR